MSLLLMLHLGLLGNNYSETDEEEEKETIDDENNNAVSTKGHPDNEESQAQHLIPVENSNNDKNVRHVGSSHSVSKSSPYQKFCNMAEVKCAVPDNIRYSCRSTPVFCTNGSQESLPPTRPGEDIPAYVLCDNQNKIMSIMVHSIQPAAFLIKHIRAHNKTEVFMPDKDDTEEDFHVSKWYIERVSLSPYFASLTDPFPGHHFLVFGTFLDAPPSIDLSCLDLPGLMTELVGSWNSPDVTGTECDHLYYYLMLSKIKNCKPLSTAAPKKFELKVSLLDKKIQRKRTMKMKKKKSQVSTTKAETITSRGDVTESSKGMEVAAVDIESPVVAEI